MLIPSLSNKPGSVDGAYDYMYSYYLRKLGLQIEIMDCGTKFSILEW